MRLKTISEKLENQKEQKWDVYSVPIDELKMDYDPLPKIGVLHPETDRVASHPLTRPAHQQLAERLDIPWKYYERMLQEETILLADNVNTWLAGNGERKFFIRGMGNDIRAILSDRYRVIDHLGVLMCALNELQGKAEVEDAHLSDTNLFLKFKCHHFPDESGKLGDWTWRSLSQAPYIPCPLSEWNGDGVSRDPPDSSGKWWHLAG